ncbi:putative protein kinase [Leptomonas pyrrhocoris]|uniref:non-specific serine/threonine protein kinase n=1 Tax=Leptomonas pyrrhocoris TaxID=157538 RepID=A0A0M9G046_LEPPY|nr:putative protein kinase [Leptomonas pyrrhocoris]XP_015657963.1 putative protein kinase [Leptomonas pyrrhocoris]KPA79523.1 putative protein kinase [Leptomonas pyrrhocoris]KPA79524.1 putative protein kinase [Leptomonas pyrrhocoris]|eukprot:XP_015657962.1 putative protein kinase [Leptomonas pyrrhocoris]
MSAADNEPLPPPPPPQQQQQAAEAFQKCAYMIDVGDLLFQGAESRVYRCSFYGTPAVCKHRFAKRYRNPTLDERLRAQRTRREARALERCLKKGIRAPRLLGADYINTFLVMSHEEGPTLKEALDAEHARWCTTMAGSQAVVSADTTPSPVMAALLRSIGVVVATLHNANMVHGDLTTSNFISTFEPPTTAAASEASNGAPSNHVSTSTTTTTAAAVTTAGARGLLSASPSLVVTHALPTAQDIVVLDFGLISEKNSAEERAVDLYVLERAITSTHPYLSSYASETILDGYRSAADPKKGAETLKRLEAVRARGRKRSMVG